MQPHCFAVQVSICPTVHASIPRNYDFRVGDAIAWFANGKSLAADPIVRSLTFPAHREIYLFSNLFPTLFEKVGDVKHRVPSRRRFQITVGADNTDRMDCRARMSVDRRHWPAAP